MLWTRNNESLISVQDLVADHHLGTDHVLVYSLAPHPQKIETDADQNQDLWNVKKEVKLLIRMLDLSVLKVILLRKTDLVYFQIGIMINQSILKIMLKLSLMRV